MIAMATACITCINGSRPWKMWEKITVSTAEIKTGGNAIHKKWYVTLKLTSSIKSMELYLHCITYIDDTMIKNTNKFVFFYITSAGDTE